MPVLRLLEGTIRAYCRQTCFSTAAFAQGSLSATSPHLFLLLVFLEPLLAELPCPDPGVVYLPFSLAIQRLLRPERARWRARTIIACLDQLLCALRGDRK